MNTAIKINRENASLNFNKLTLFGIISLQLIALVLVSHWYELEGLLHLPTLLLISLVGFWIHSFVSAPFKLYFFALLSLVMLTLIMGFTNMAGVLVIGSIVTLVASLIRSKLLKYGLLAIIFSVLIGLMVLKPDWIHPHILVISTLGSMFVFRLSLLLYEKNYQKERPHILKDLSYFFMLPNMSILLFPVVDYRLFLKNYYNEDALNIYKKGVQWIALGVFHLVLYRFVYHHLIIPVSEVKDVVSMWHYMATNYLLIIRLSGLFHIAIGILCLFGFNLPRVFNNYFLASGFTDLWRRINIYFRDYVIRIFYYPLFFRFRKWGEINAKVIAILIIFMVTWFLHSFQWFWLRGFFPVRLVDAVFWGLFGLLVALNAVWESKNRGGRPDTSSWKYAGTITAQIIGMFLVMSVLWSIWSAANLQDWINLTNNLIHGNISKYTYLLLGLVGIWGFGTWLFRLFEINKWGKIIDPDPKSGMATFWSVAMIAFLILLQWSPVKNSAERIFSTELDGLLSHKLSQEDEFLLVEGYYEEILIGNQLTNPVGEMQGQQGPRFRDSEAAILVDDMRNLTIKPNVETIFKGLPFTTNQWGMRDKDFPEKPEPNTIRVGFSGGSFVVGSGVRDEDVFDQVLEKMFEDFDSNYNYEFINMGTSGYDLIQSILDFEVREQYKFELDYLVYVSHGVDLYKNTRTLLTAYNNKTEIPYDFMREIIDKSGIDRSMTEREQMELLTAYDRELVERSYLYFYEMSASRGIKPVWFYWPTIASFIDQSALLENIAKTHGLSTINLRGVYDNYDHSRLTVSRTDRHPNKLGHQLVAEALFEKFQSDFQLKKNPLQYDQ